MRGPDPDPAASAATTTQLSEAPFEFDPARPSRRRHRRVQGHRPRLRAGLCRRGRQGGARCAQPANLDAALAAMPAARHAPVATVAAQAASARGPVSTTRCSTRQRCASGSRPGCARKRHALTALDDANRPGIVRRRAPVEPPRDRGAPRWSRSGAASGRSVVVSRPPWSRCPARPAVPRTSDARAHRLGAASARGDGGDRHRERRARL